jgi:phosphatidylserine decarboxylase
LWDIDKNSRIVSQAGVYVKATKFYSIPEIVGTDNPYKDAFANGKFTHTFLNVDDYHHFHFPVSGVIKYVSNIPGLSSLGGVISWDRAGNQYTFESKDPAWQGIETRGCVIVDTGKYGLVAILPIGMAQIASVNFEDSVKIGATVKKGDPLGYFLFGGSDFIMIFQQKAGFTLQAPPVASETDTYEHLLMGQRYGQMLGKK